MRYIIAFLSWLPLFSIQAQEYIQISNLETKEPIPFASIRVKNQILYSNLNGQVEKRFFIESGSFTISSIGFESKELNGFEGLDTVFLAPKIVQIPTVEVLPDEARKKIEIGFHKNRTLIPETFIGQDSLILAVYIPNENGKRQINEIIYSLKHLEKSDQFIALLFEVAENRKPGTTLYRKVVNVGNLNRKGRLDVSDERILFPEEGLFVGFAWVSNMRGQLYNLYGEAEVKVANNKVDTPTFIHNRINWKSLGEVLPRFGLSIFE